MHSRVSGRFAEHWVSVGFDGGSIGAFLASRARPLDFRCLACEAEASQARATKPTLLVETPPDSSPALSYYEEQRGVRAPISEISEALLGGVHIGSSPLGQGRTEFKRISIPQAEFGEAANRV